MVTDMKKLKRVKPWLTRVRVKEYIDVVDHEKVKAMRERANLTQAGAARAMGWTAQHWGDFEWARHPNPRIGTLLAVADVLGCDVPDLLKS